MNLDYITSSIVKTVSEVTEKIRGARESDITHEYNSNKPFETAASAKWLDV